MKKLIQQCQEELGIKTIPTHKYLRWKNQKRVESLDQEYKEIMGFELRGVDPKK